jgi:hypothetical protein
MHGGAATLATHAMRCGQALVKKQLEDFKKWRDDFVSGA